MSFFVTFEGIEGSGKTTQIKLLADVLTQQGCKIVLTREPGGTAIGDQIRKILLDSANQKIAHTSELLLYAASRAQLCQEVIQPALQAGKIILCDRFTDSTLAYQEGGRKLSPQVIEQVNQWSSQGLKPKLTFLIDCPVELGLGRAQKRILQQQETEDRFEKESLEFHQRVRERYLKIAKEEPHRFVIIDGTQAIDKIHQDILLQIKPHLS